MWRPSAILCCILMTAGTARPGQIVKNDDTTESGQIIAFDGKDVQLRKVYGSNELVSIPFHDVTRVQFHEGRGPDDWTPQRLQGRLPPIWQLKLTNGDSVSGELRAWSESQFDLRLQVDEPLLNIPIPLIHDIWRNAPELVRKALDLKTTSTTQDIAYVFKDNDVIAVNGTALGIENNALAFIHEGEKKAINTDRLLGVVLAPQKRTPATRPAETGQAWPHKLVLLNADVLTGRWTKLQDVKVTFETSWGQKLQFRAEPVWRIETVDNTSVFLSDLKPLRVEQTPYFDRLIPWRADTALDGGPLQLNDGHQYSRGISMHSRCVLEYDLDSKFDRFTARLGFEPVAPNLPPGRLAIRIRADTASRFESSDFRSDQPPKDLTIDVHGAKHLTLEVDFGPDQDVNDRVVFANARLLHSTKDN